MAIPDFQTLMLPLLKLLADKQEHSMRDVTPTLSNQFHLTEDEKLEASAVSGQPVMYNRSAWAKTYLKRAGLIEQTRRGFFKISAEGEKVLKSNPSAINIKFLKQFPEYNAINDNGTQSSDEATAHPETPAIKLSTPDELIESGVKSIRADLILELLQLIREGSPEFFERLGKARR